MRKKLQDDKIRSTIIGVKVTKNIKEKIDYVADKEGYQGMSSYIYQIIIDALDKYESEKKVNLQKEIDEIKKAK